MQGTVLVVDDDPNLLTVTAVILKRFGYEVVTAGSGAEAIDAWRIRTAPVDLLMTDIFMAGMNGIELASALGELQPGLRVVFTSGSTREEVDALFADPDDVRLLKKPASVEHLVECVRQAIAGE